MNRSTRLVAVFLAIITAVAAPDLLGQTAPIPVDDAPIRVDTVLVNIPVIVSDPRGRYVTGLKKEDFTVLLDGEKQEIEYFADTDVPLSISIVVDVSGSTAPFLGDIKKAAKAFVDQLRPTDRAMLVTFHQGADVISPLTSDFAKLKKKIDGLGVGGGTLDGRPGSNMYDPVYRLLKNEMREATGRKAMIILTDGFVNRMVEAKDFKDAVVEGDTLIYPMMFLTEQTKRMKLQDLVYSPPGSWMNALALQTGGRLLITGDNKDFQKAFESVAEELRRQYVVGFYPSGATKPKNIAIELSRKDLSTRSKATVRIKANTDPK
jgi:VWFA-related protein